MCVWCHSDEPNDNVVVTHSNQYYHVQCIHTYHKHCVAQRSSLFNICDIFKDNETKIGNMNNENNKRIIRASRREEYKRCRAIIFNSELFEFNNALFCNECVAKLMENDSCGRQEFSYQLRNLNYAKICHICFEWFDVDEYNRNN